MKKLSKQQQEKLTELWERIGARARAVEEAYEDLRDRIQAVWETTTEPAVVAYNEAVAEFEDFRADVALQILAHAESKSERWFYSDAGQAHHSWLSDWEQSLEEIPVVPPDPPDPPDQLHPEDADDYPVAPDAADQE